MKTALAQDSARSWSPPSPRSAPTLPAAHRRGGRFATPLELPHRRAGRFATPLELPHRRAGRFATPLELPRGRFHAELFDLGSMIPSASFRTATMLSARPGLEPSSGGWAWSTPRVPMRSSRPCRLTVLATFMRRVRSNTPTSAGALAARSSAPLPNSSPWWSRTSPPSMREAPWSIALFARLRASGAFTRRMPADSHAFTWTFTRWKGLHTTRAGTSAARSTSRAARSAGTIDIRRRSGRHGPSHALRSSKAVSEASTQWMGSGASRSCATRTVRTRSSPWRRSSESGFAIS